MTIALAIIVLVAVAYWTRPKLKREDLPRDWEQ